MSLQRFLSSVARYARTNRARLAFFSLAGVGVAAAAIYCRRKYEDIQELLRERQEMGTGVLRNVFSTNVQTVQSATEALLPLIRVLRKSCSHTEPEELVRQLKEEDLERAKKHEIWQQLKAATFAEIVTLAMVISTVYVSLALQVNLVSRYTRTNEEAPVESLPCGPLEEVTRKKFISSIRENVVSTAFADSLLSASLLASKVALSDISLKHRLTREDVSGIVHEILENIHSSDIRELSPTWIFKVDTSGNRDVNLDALLEESLDLADALDMQNVIYNVASSLSDIGLESLSTVDWDSANGVPCALVLAPLLKAKDVILSSVPDASEPEVEHFSASVMLSGERDIPTPASRILHSWQAATMLGT